MGLHTESRGGGPIGMDRHEPADSVRRTTATSENRDWSRGGPDTIFLRGLRAPATGTLNLRTQNVTSPVSGDRKRQSRNSSDTTTKRKFNPHLTFTSVNSRWVSPQV